jgi:hypothetical protein
MAGLKIKNETVYVIYRNGEPYQKAGRKIVYTSKGAANGVITADTYDEAYENYKKIRTESRYTIAEWYYLPDAEREKFIEDVKSQFELVEYVPKKKNN